MLDLQLTKAKQTLGIAHDNIVGIFLYGSQNYKLEYDESDIDSILLVRAADEPKRELRMSTGVVKVYTLDYFVQRLKHGDLECYEILYTKYKILNSSCEKTWMNFVQAFSNCMNYDRLKRSLHIKLDEHLINVRWIKFNKDNSRYNKKRLYWAIRVCDQLSRLNDGENFESSLIYQDRIGHDLIKIKTVPNYLNLREFTKVYSYLVEFIGRQPIYTNSVSDEEEKCLFNLMKLEEGGTGFEYT